jgi:hypothetical protein
MKTTFLLFCILLATISSGLCELVLFDIHSLEDCGDNVSVKSASSRKYKELVSVTVTIKPTDSDSYQGRVHASGWLVVKNAKGTIAASELKSAEKEGAFTFTFALDRKAFEHSEFTMSSYLTEKTLGGGETYRLHLAGFQPDEQSLTE